MHAASPSTRYYVHGDLHETKPNTYFCVLCDLSAPADHFDDERHVKTRAKMYQYSLETWARRAKAKPSIFYRQANPQNIIAELALADIKASEAAKSPFFRWLLRQLKRDDPIGDLAQDVRSDTSFPISSTNLDDLRTHLVLKHAIPEAFVALDEAWAEWRSKGRARAGLTTKARFVILKRDSYRCRICGTSADDGCRLEVDHKVPVAKGGSNDPENLWTLCFDCNRGKGTHDL